MAIQETKNRDLFFKIVLVYYLMHILKIFGIDEKLKEILPTELITFETNDYYENIRNGRRFFLLVKRFSLF